MNNGAQNYLTCLFSNRIKQSRLPTDYERQVSCITFTARPKINSHSQIFRYGRSIFYLPYLPKFTDFIDLCLHWVCWVSVVHDFTHFWKKNWDSHSGPFGPSLANFIFLQSKHGSWLSL